MKTWTKPRAKLSRRRGEPLRKRRHTVKNLASQGLNADVIAAKVGLNKNTLRAEHALDLHAGREIRAAEQAAEVVITKEEYYFLDAASLSFSEPGWFEPDCGNLLFLGPNGEAARNLADAFAGWKAEGGRFITAGLSGKFNQKNTLRLPALFRTTGKN